MLLQCPVPLTSAAATGMLRSFDNTQHEVLWLQLSSREMRSVLDATKRSAVMSSVTILMQLPFQQTTHL